LPVKWADITRRGGTETNYQLLPGDRLYVKADCFITLYTYIDRVLAPLDRLMGDTLLGVATYRSLRFIGSGVNGAGTGGIVP
jgi:polysaccharide export outer membrane protein